MAAWLVLSFVTAAVWAPAAVRAEVPERLALVVDEGTAAEVDADALAAALGAELGCAVDRTAAEGELIVRLRSVGPRRTRVEVTRPGQRTEHRVARLDRAREERVATLVIVVSNLVRDEASEILAMLQARRGARSDATEAGQVAEGEREGESVGEGESAGVSEGEGEGVSAGEGEGEGAVESEGVSAGESEVENEVESEVEVENDVENDVEVENEVEHGLETPPPSPPHDPLVRLGLDAQLGSVPAGSGLDLAWLAGLEVAWTPFSFLAIGLRDVGGGYARNTRWSVGGVAFAELAWRFADWGDLHGQLGVHVQYLSALVVGATAVERVGVAPVLVLGARVFPLPFFSVSIETALRGVVTDAFHTGLDVIPQGAFLWTGGLAVAFHFG